ncbi:DUF3107 domain-containing protein [Isoptericola variabilis]|uniref:ATP-binding protein n=1 Tax=Isoptericola variabilis (strain 225) TaxID=743718 RepID=F6FXA8_ISOV2|nr:DUF3107 domain-containing protein [Isoptericola variabilis]AEG43611.1 hypothetical protein Isova_0825 [Isoptericola variabilis 225]TWH32021.1 uncharacterized protein DUF3107 [Isoptericola variabilis J7]
MEVTIGVQNLTRELVVETDQTSDEVAAAVKEALDGGTSFELTDSRGRRVIVPATAIGYVELGTGAQRPVGFGSL